ncbi:MAG: UDP-N-acetylmuramoyl-tripeptide--D-alanyl-D-alanine ligase [Chloroflexia bacterium]
MITLRDAKMGAHASLTSHHPINLDETVAAVAVDSRTVERGTSCRDPRRAAGRPYYIPDAVAAGATAVMLAEPPPSPLPEGVVFLRVEDTVRALGELAAYHRRRMHPKVIGITGSVGKTTTKEVLANVLSSRYRTLRNQKSLNNEIGVPLTLLALRPEIEVAVVEIGGAYALGEIEHLCGIARPSVGIVTNVGSAHIGRMGSVEKIAETKSELVACLPADGVAVLNADDPYVRGMAAKARAPCGGTVSTTPPRSAPMRSRAVGSRESAFGSTLPAVCIPSKRPSWAGTACILHSRLRLRQRRSGWTRRR